VQLFNEIQDLELATGLKELLINNGFFTIDQLLKTATSELATILGTDDYIARLVIMAAKRQSRTVSGHFS